MNAQLSAEEKSAFEEEIPAGRFGTPQEVVDLVWNLVNSPSYLPVKSSVWMAVIFKTAI